ITTKKMTRFLLSLEQAVDTVFAAVRGARRGETYIPRVPSASVMDVARALIGNRSIKIVETGIRPGEKVDEILISEEECHRAVDRGNYYAILPILPELRDSKEPLADLHGEYSSGTDVLAYDDVVALLEQHQLMPQDAPNQEVELVR